MKGFLLRLKQLSKNFVSKTGWDLIAIEVGESDHIHIMLRLEPKYSISKVVQILKTDDSLLCMARFSITRKHYWKRDWLWSTGYFCSTTGEASAETIRKYIENQR